MHRLQWLTLVLLTALVAASAQAETWYVPSPECPTIQSGIFAAAYGDTVLVAPGTYYEHDIIMNSGRRLIADTGGGDYAIIDASGIGRGIRCLSCDSSTRIEGFYIRNGSADSGGGILCLGSSPEISDCVFFANVVTGDGGGMYCDPGFTFPTLTDCNFDYNTAGESGGGMYCGSATLVGCSFWHNTAANFGGALSGTDLTLTECDFRYNSANFGGGLSCGNLSGYLCWFLYNNASSLGGGVFALGGGALETSYFYSNTSDDGGGAVFCAPYGEFILNDCQFWENSAHDGGALHAEDGQDVTVTGCSFGGNTATDSGGAIRIAGVRYVTISQCTLADNSAAIGGGIYEGPTDYGPTVTNTIIAFNTGGGGYCCVGAAPDVFCTDIYGNTGGDWSPYLVWLAPPTNDNMEVDPEFCRLDGWFDYKLQEDSPCAEENNPECGHIGARPVGCPDMVGIVDEPMSWGAIKSIFR